MKILYFFRYSLEIAKADLKTIFSLFPRVVVDRICAVEITYVDSCVECLVLISDIFQFSQTVFSKLSFGFSDHVRC